MGEGMPHTTLNKHTHTPKKEKEEKEKGKEEEKITNWHKNTLQNVVFTRIIWGNCSAQGIQ